MHQHEPNIFSDVGFLGEKGGEKKLVRNVLSDDVWVFLVPCGRLVAGYFMGGTQHKCGVAHSLG